LSPLPLFLALECSTRNCSVALFEENRLLDCLEESPEFFVHSDRLHSLIEELFTQTRRAFAELSAVGVGIGPGSYTGLRIGLSSAKGLCYALEIPLIGISSLEVLFHTQKRLESPLAGHPYTSYHPMLDARRMEVYTAEFDAIGRRISPDRPMILTEEVPQNSGLCFGDGSNKAFELLQAKGHSVVDGPLPSARAMGVPIFERWKAAEFEALDSAHPVYLKEFKAGKPSETA
jgi:tRNA threonylcarbamoyladenosine biosynthesis protein TsaB